MVYHLDRRELTSWPYLGRLVIGNRPGKRRLVFWSASLTLESSVVLRLPLAMVIGDMMFRSRCQGKKRSREKQLLEDTCLRKHANGTRAGSKVNPMPVVTIEISGAVRSSNRALKPCNHSRILK